MKNAAHLSISGPMALCPPALGTLVLILACSPASETGTGGTAGPTGAAAGGTAGSGGVGVGGAAGNGAGGIGAGSGLGGSAGSTGGAGGGTGAAGGSAGTGMGGGGSGGTGTTVACNITLEDASVSTAIATVGIVTWSTDLAGVDDARIEFGLDTNYGMTAPVDLSEPDYRTLLLGMKPSSDYHFRIVASSGGADCVGPDQTITTGPVLNRLRQIEVNTPSPDDVTSGFIVTGEWQGGPPFIIDTDGEYVWWHDAPGEVTRARMSYDGKYMWMTHGNVGGGDGEMKRVSMDGLTVETFDEFGDMHHDFTVLPDESIGFIQHGPGGADSLMERTPDGEVHRVIDMSVAHGGSGNSHGNSVHYHPEDDTYTFSDLNENCYVKVTRSGEVVWVLGGNQQGVNQFTGDGASWNRQHGHDVLANDRFLFFNNNDMGSNSLAIEVQLDPTPGTMTATRLWEYDGGNGSNVMGDVQRLANGNTLVTYSASGVIHEVNEAKTLLREFAWPIGGALGYAMLRDSLYGPPPK